MNAILHTVQAPRSFHYTFRLIPLVRSRSRLHLGFWIGAFMCFLLLVGLIPQAVQAQSVPAYLNPDLPTDQRVDDLVGRMTLEEKVSQLMDQAAAVERLGIPQYNWWNEALHGVARAGLATVFPQAIGFAATWDEDLIFRMATVISDEARAKHHEFVRNDARNRYQGLTIWSPNINLFRDPRWGRGQETYGEDPTLTGRIAVQFIKGLQGDDPNYLKTVSTVKHFAVHSGPEPERHVFDAVADERDFWEYYMPMFKTGIMEGGAYSLMCAYNRVNGEAACGSDYLLNNILRTQWKFDGYVVSDCWALDDIYRNHQLVGTAAEAAALALKSGTDLDCGSRVNPTLVDAVAQGLTTEAEIDVALKRLFTARMRLGMFDPPERVLYSQIPYDVVDSAPHKEMAKEVTRNSMVLLKNDGILPLPNDLGKIAVIGPNSDQWLMLLGNYNGVPSETVTPLEGIRAAVSSGTEVIYARGADLAEGFPMYDAVPGDVLFTADGQPGLTVDYYGNYDMEGEPLFSSIDAQLDADWGDRAPREDMDPDDFSVRWSGTLRPEHTGTYRLGAISTSKFQLFVDDSLAVQSRYNYRDEFGDPRMMAGRPIELEAGESYRVRLIAQESYGDASMQLVWTSPSQELEVAAIEAAEQADAVVLFMGLTPRLEGEEMRIEIEGFRGGDRTDIKLPEAQQELMERIVALGKPTVLVLLNGSAVAVNWAQENVPAILEAWYPGQAAGTAIADVLFGNFNPAGRLPVTFYKSVEDLPPFEDYSMEGRTYLHFKGEPLYPFGHGLSYTTFGYSNLRTSSETISAGETIEVSVDVSNTGRIGGDEVPQLYVRFPNSSVIRPNKQLRDFARVPIGVDQTKTVRFEIKADDLRYWDPDADRWVLERTPLEIQIGASSTDIRVTHTIQITP